LNKNAMTVQLNRKSFTIEEYHRLGEIGILSESDHVELINGDIVTMSPTKSHHAGMVDLLVELLIHKLYKKATIKCQNPITIVNHSEPEPDVVIAHYRSDAYSKQHPTPEDIYVVIEVSDSTLEKDQEVKHPLYAKAEIPEYWIVNLIDNQIEIYRQPKNGEYHFKQIISEEGEVKVANLELSFNYTDLFNQVDQ